MVQLSHLHVSTGKTIALTIWTFVGKVMSLLFNMPSRLVIFFLPRRKHLLISWLQSMPTVIFSSVQLLSRVRLFATPWIAAHQASLSITNSWSSLRLTSVKSVMPSSRLILCHPLFLLPPISPSIRVFSNESTLGMRWPKYWSFSFSIIPSKEHPGLISFRICSVSHKLKLLNCMYLYCFEHCLFSIFSKRTFLTVPPKISVG